MKNLKKVLAFVTMITMLLSVAVSAGTLYPDVDDAASYAEAVTTLNALDIMIGDENGNFNPDASITRAEAAAIVTRIKALGAAASAAGGTKFTDVAADHWAAGYVNLAEQSGIINGYGDGTFGPSDAVTYEQMIKMIVAALGRAPEAETKGGYPSGYLIVASQENITNGVSVTPGAEAPRAAVGRLAFNALTVDVMEQVAYKAGEEEYEVKEGKNLLKDYLKVHKVEGIVTDTYLTASEIDTEADKYVKIDADKVDGIRVTEDSDHNDTLADAAETGLLEGETDAASLYGKSVSAYVRQDDETGDWTLIGIAEKSGRNKVLVLDESQIKAYGDGELEYLASPTDRKNTTVKVASELLYAYNNGYECVQEGEELVNLVNDFLDDVEAGADVFGTITMIDNDAEEGYDVIMLKQATANYIVGEVNAAAKTLDDKDANNIPVDVEDEEVITKLYNADGVEIAFEDIAVENIITVYENEAGLVAAYVSDVVVTGTVSEKDEIKGSYVIGDAEYKIAFVDGSPVATLNVGEEGKFYVNVEGKIVGKVAIAATGSYAYLYKAVETSNINGDSIEVKFLTSEGVWETKTLASKVSVQIGAADANPVTIATLKNIEAGAKPFGDLIDITVETETEGEGEDAVEVAVGFTASATEEANERVFQYTTNSAGQINKLFVSKAEDNSNPALNKDEFISIDKTASEKEYSADKNKIGGIYLNNETTVFSIPTDISAADEDDFKVTKVSALFVDSCDYTIEAYDIVNNIPSLVVAYGASADILAGTKLLVVTKVSEVKNEAGNNVQKIYGYQNGAEVSGLLTEELDLVTELEAGDVVLYSLDADGNIDNVDVLMDNATAQDIINLEAPVMAAADEDDEFAVSYFGFVYKKANGLMYLTQNWNDGTALVDVSDDTELALPINNLSGVNVYEINLNNTNKTTQVLKGASYIDAVTRAGRDAHWAFVRVYDDAIVDIVVYRTTNLEKAEEPAIEIVEGSATITTTEVNATIYYSVDGADFEKYEEAVVLENGETIEAFVAVDGKIDSSIVDATYTAEPV